MTITLYLIRHGATKSNKRHAYLGNTNEPLSNEGGEQIIFYNEAGRYPELELAGVQINCLLCKRLQERKAERFSALLVYCVYFRIFVRG